MLTLRSDETVPPPVTARGSRSLDRAAQCSVAPTQHQPTAVATQWVTCRQQSQSRCHAVTHHAEQSDRETGNLMDIDFDQEMFGECLCWDT